MTQFFDALTGKKRELIYRPERPKTSPDKPSCEDQTGGHIWDNEDDDQCKCKVCRMSVVQVQALRNIRTKKVKIGDR